MLSYKRENGGNEKLMGWEGGITTKSIASWSRTSKSQIFHSEFINSKANSAKCFHSRDFLNFPTTTKEKKKDRYRKKKRILDLIRR